MAQEIYKMGWYIGVDGPLTYKNAAKLPEIVEKFPLERILLETDAPYLAPVPMRGKQNEPAFVRYVAEKVAEIKGISVENVAKQTSTNAEELYREAERLAKELKDGQNRAQESPEDFADLNKPEPKQQAEKTKPKPYSGPSVLSWSLPGRNASRLPIPAYRCIGAGEVTVIIAVNNQGQVINAKVDDGVSSSDGCLRAFAIRAARLSRFSASTTAPSRQMGTITYAFIAQ
jgi:hypothetical protein